MLICNRNAPSGHAHVSTCFLGYLQHHIHTHDTEQAHTAHVHTAHKPASSPPAALLLLTHAAQYPDVLTKARWWPACMVSMQGLLHGYDNHTPRGQMASNMNFRDGQKKSCVSPPKGISIFWCHSNKIAMKALLMQALLLKWQEGHLFSEPDTRRNTPHCR